MSYTTSVTPRLRQILQSSDLSTVSAKAVRKELVRLGENEETVKANRKDIDAKISEIYDELTGPGSRASSSSEEIALTSSRPSGSAAGGGGHVSMPPSSFPEPLADRKPKIKPEAKEEKPKPRATTANGDSSRNGNVVETDEQMARRLQEEFDALEGGGRPSRRTAAARPKKTKKKAAGVTPKKRKSAATVDDDESGEDGDKPVKKRRAGGGSGAFNKDLVLSDALAEFTGEARLSRPQTVKRIWDYVKSHDLQDTGDKRFIICDDRLKAVFHVDRLHMFTMNKLLSQHFMDPDDIIYKEEPIHAANTDIKPIHRPPPPAPAPMPISIPASMGGASAQLPRPAVTAEYEESDDDDEEEDDEEDEYEEEE